MQFESSGWSGDGTFTAALLDALRTIEALDILRVEDAPASRAEPGYAFISNEFYVRFRTDRSAESARRFGLPWGRRSAVKQMTLADLASQVALIDGIGEPDYSDDGMLQYLRTERIIPPYQTRGYKVVEMVRVYEMGTVRRG
jgi:hypothetical protein